MSKKIALLGNWEDVSRFLNCSLMLAPAEVEGLDTEETQWRDCFRALRVDENNEYDYETFYDAAAPLLGCPREQVEFQTIMECAPDFLIPQCFSWPWVVIKYGHWGVDVQLTRELRSRVVGGPRDIRNELTQLKDKYHQDEVVSVTVSIPYAFLQGLEIVVDTDNGWDLEPLHTETCESVIFVGDSRSFYDRRLKQRRLQARVPSVTKFVWVMMTDKPHPGKRSSPWRLLRNKPESMESVFVSVAEMIHPLGPRPIETIIA